MPFRTITVALIGLLLAACGEQKHEFELLVPPLEFDQEIAREIVAVFEEHSRHTIKLVDVPDEYETALDALEDGVADLAFASNLQAFRENVATVMPLYPTVLHIIYLRGRDASNARTLMTGATINAGPVGSASRQLMKEVLQSWNLSEDDVTFMEPRQHVEELPDVVVLYFAIVPDIVVSRLATIGATGRYEFFPLGRPEDIGTGSGIDRAVLLNPKLSPFVIPVEIYGDIPREPIVTLAVDKLLVANPEIENAEIYDLINEIRRLQPALSAKRPTLFQGLREEFSASDSTFVLHAGAHAFTQRDAPDVYERYSGVAEVLVTLVIGLISGTYAVIQIYNRRRKNRIDAFYTDVMALRDSITDDSSLSERESAVEKVRTLQNQAFELLVNEKVAADESFRIFVTLSNDIIADLRKPTV